MALIWIFVTSLLESSLWAILQKEAKVNLLSLLRFSPSFILGLFRNPRSEIARFLTRKHAGHYRVYNLCSEQTYSPSSIGGEVVEFAFGDHQAPPLSLIVEFCEDAERWLLGHPENTVVVHCKAGKGRTGIMICALLMYMGLCEGPEAALKLFAQERTADGKGVTIPSQRRSHFSKFSPFSEFCFQIYLLFLSIVSFWHEVIFFQDFAIAVY